MKKIILFALIISSVNVFSQCEIDTDCTIEPAFPNICPINLPDGTIGEFYSEEAVAIIEVSAVNDAPVVEHMVLESQEDIDLDVTLIGSDIEGSPLIYSL